MSEREKVLDFLDHLDIGPDAELDMDIHIDGLWTFHTSMNASTIGCYALMSTNTPDIYRFVSFFDSGDSGTFIFDRTGTLDELVKSHNSSQEL